MNSSGYPQSYAHDANVNCALKRIAFAIRWRALKNAKYERYCRLRASAQPRIQAYRETGWETSDDDDAYSNACRLERRPRIKDRIEYFSKQQEDLIAEKRHRIEERLWAIH